ncbi:MAG: hypothetical protein ACODAE_10455, partial [Gemmatimonadota bacterium]
MRHAPASTTVLSLLALTAPLAAPSAADALQDERAAEHIVDDDVLRRWFAFPGNELTIEVLADSPGRLSVMRGEPGTIRVTGRIVDGLAEAGLAGRQRDRLTLHAIGAGEAAFIVVVPEAARVRVRLPDRDATETVGTRTRNETYA